MTDPSYGFRGLAESAPTNVQLQLDNFMPDDVDQLLVPAGGGGPAMPLIRQWITDAFGPDTYTEVTDVVGELIKIQEETGEQSVLVIVMGEDEISDTDRNAVARALEAGVRVRSINHMMDDVTEHDIVSEQAPASPEPVAEAPPASKRARRTPAASKPAQAVSEPQESKPRGRPRRTAASPEPVPGDSLPVADPVAPAMVPADPEALWQGTSKELLALIDARVEVMLRTRTMVTVDVTPF